jgi:hypothetical protein
MSHEFFELSFHFPVMAANDGRDGDIETRKFFSYKNDIMLLLAMSDACPWATPRNDIMACWERIAQTLRDQVGFISNKSGTACKSHFDLIYRTFVKGEAASKRKSGTNEDFEERDALLTDIHSRIEDFKTAAQAERDVQMRKAAAIETAGQSMRRMAMEAMSYSANDEDHGAGTVTFGGESSDEGDVDMDMADAFSGDDSPEDVMTFQSTKNPSKRRNVVTSSVSTSQQPRRRRTKPTKRQKVDKMLDHLDSTFNASFGQDNTVACVFDYLKHAEERRSALEEARLKDQRDFMNAMMATLASLVKKQ